MRSASGLLKFSIGAALLLGGIARGQDIISAPTQQNPAALNNVRPSILNQVGIDQNLGAQISPDLKFKDETGKDVKIGDYFGKRPIILTMVYFDCPMLCTLVLNDLTRSMRAMSESAGTDFDIITVSFDPKEKPSLALEKKRSYIATYNRQGADQGWHFLTGDDENIKKLASTVGFKYSWDAKNKVFAHAAGIMILTPDGKVSKYFYGIDYAPRDVQLSLVEAAGSKIGGTSESFLLYCFHYDPATGKYGLAINRALKIGGVLTLLGIGSFIGLMMKRPQPTAIKKALEVTPGNMDPKPK